MTLADILKPSATVVLHAQAKGSQLGATVGVALAIPAISLAPTTFNAADAPPLVAIARLCGGAALVGTTAATLAAAIKLARLSREEIRGRAEKLEASELNRADVVASSAGAAAGLALLMVRINRLAEVRGESFANVLGSWEGARDAYCFAVMGAAVGLAGVKGFKFVACKVGARKECCGVEEVEQSVAEATGEMRAVGESVEQAVDNMAGGEESAE
ncbi:unnamed protein product [Agarophyton chilense]